MSLPATIALVVLAAMVPLWWRPADAWDAMPPLDFKRFAYVRTSVGRLRGFETEVGVPPRSALIFKRIPYAAPPVGGLRFRKAQRPNRWIGDWDATKYGPACLSNTSMITSPQKNISEDCLHVNIFTSPGCVNSRRKCPVLFYIHGGGLYYNSAMKFSDRQIAEKYASDDVVFVIPAFRLGVFASFDVGDPDIVPPNLGLEDIIFALEWTRREIRAFGGDPSRLTVMGNSGGGFITQMLMAHRRVPQSLFQRAIVSSGVSTSANWGAAQPLSNAVLNWFNCSAHSVGGKRAQVACLRGVNATALLEAQQVLIEKRGFLFAPVTPTADLPLDDLGRLLRQIKPRTLWAAVTSDEYRPERENTISSTCQEAASWFDYKSQAVQQACLQRFYPNQGPNEHPAKDVREVAQTSAMHARTLLLALVNAHKFESSYYSTFALANHSQHSDDLLFFFGLHWTRRAYTPAEALMDRYYPQVIKNFVRHGRPESFWRPIESDGKGYFVFDFAVDVNSTSSVNEAATERTLRRLRLTRWPRFVKDAYDDPTGDKFWLLDQARTEAASLSWAYRRRAHGSGNQGDDDNNENENEKNQYSGNGPNNHIFSTILFPSHGEEKSHTGNVTEAQREYKRQQQKKFDAHRRPYRVESDEFDDYQPVHEYDIEEKNKNANEDHKNNEDEIHVFKEAKRRTLADAKERVKRRQRDDFRRAGENLTRLRKYLEAKRRHNYRNDRNRNDNSGNIVKSFENEEPASHTSRKSVETTLRFSDSPTVDELLDDVEQYVKRRNRNGEPLVEPSRISIEWADRSKHQTTVGDLINDLKRHVKWKDFKDEPLIESSRTSIEWAVDGGEAVDEVTDNVKNWAKKKERRDEPWIRPSRTSIEWAQGKERDEPKDNREEQREWDQAEAYEKINNTIPGLDEVLEPTERHRRFWEAVKAKQLKKAPWVLPSRTSIEWAQGKKWIQDHIQKSRDSSEKSQHSKQDEYWNEAADKFWKGIKEKALKKANGERRKSKTPFDNIPFSYRMNITRGPLNCTYEARRAVGQQRALAHFKCVRANGTQSHGNGSRDGYSKFGKNWKYVNSNSENDNDDDNAANNYRSSGGYFNDSYRNQLDYGIERRKHWRRDEPCLDCRPNSWWYKIDHDPGPVRLPPRNDKNAKNVSSNDKGATHVSLNVNGTRWSVHDVANISPNDNSNADTVIDKEPPFWLPFIAFNFNSAFPPKKDADDNDTVTEDAEGVAIATIVEIEDDDLMYYDALERLRITEDALRSALTGRISVDALPLYYQTVTASSDDLPLSWLALSIVALAIAVALIVVAARLLFRYRNQHKRGYNHNSRAGDYLDETSRILSNSRGSAPKYSN